METDHTLTQNLEAALTSPSPRGQLQKLMSHLLESGWERSDLLPALEAYQAQLAQAGRGEEADLILEIIDGFTGWCQIPPVGMR